MSEEDAQVNRQMNQLLEQVSFAGSGRYARFGSVDTVDPRQVSMFDRPNLFEPAQFAIVNRSGAPRLEGLVPDSDQDGLSDQEEILAGTDPLKVDSDGDGIGDLVEARIGLSHTVLDDPSICKDLRRATDTAAPEDELIIQQDPYTFDRDFDGLNECEERLISFFQMFDLYVVGDAP